MEWKSIFPYHRLRPLQESFINDLIRSVRKYDVTTMIAPNGFGKTVSILSALHDLDFERVYYTSRTSQQAKNVINTIKVINEKNGRAVLSGIELSGRDKLCINMTGHDFGNGSDAFSKCMKMKGENYCKDGHESESWLEILHVDDARKIDIPDVISCNDIIKIAIEKKLCPYYFARSVYDKFDVVACSYNHVFDPFVRRSIGVPIDNSLIICDEAHNIINVLESFMTKKLSTSGINDMLRSPVNFHPDIIKILKRLDHVMVDVVSRFEKTSAFFNSGEFKDILSEYGISNKWLGWAIMTMKGENDIDGFLTSVLSFLYFLKQQEGGEKKDVFLQKERVSNGMNYTFKLMMMDIDSMLQDILSSHGKILFLSGTLSPQFFEKRFGRSMNVKEYHLEKRKLNVYLCDRVPGTRKKLSSYYQVRDDDEILVGFGKYAFDIIDSIPRGTIFFFPSYTYLFNVVDAWKMDGLMTDEDDGTFFITRGGDRIQTFVDGGTNSKMIINDYKSSVDSNNKALLFSVFRGSASEGEDFPGHYCQSVFCVGLPIKNVTGNDVKYRIDYYNTIKKGLGLFWLRWDAMIAVNQSIGRGIRDPINDKAVVLLLDARYNMLDYQRLFVSWVRDCVRLKGRDATPCNIKRDIVNFFE